jgi:hypothetical protein
MVAALKAGNAARKFRAAVFSGKMEEHTKEWTDFSK